MAHQGTKMEPIPYTIALIKPDTAVNEERVNEILDKIEENGLTIYERETRILDREDALNLYAKFKHREFFQELCDYITSGPVEILLLT